MVKVESIVQNKMGIHCRPSAVILKEAAMYPDHHITVHSQGNMCELNSVLQLLTMGLCHGTQVSIEVTGPREEIVAQRMAELFAREFDFPPRDTTAGYSDPPA